MKYISKLSILFLLPIVLGISISSCTNEDPVVLTVKPTADFIKQYKDYYTTQRQILDTCYAGYKRSKNYALDTIGYLKGYYNRSQGLNFTQYYNAYLADLKVDSALLAKPDVKLGELIAINKKMATSGFYFINKINLCDHKELYDSIIAGRKVYSSVVLFSGYNGAAAGKVLAYDRGQLLTVITSAEVTRDSANLAAPLINRSLASLQVAIKAYYDAIIPSDFATYQAKCFSYIKDQLTLCYSVKVGYGYNEYVPYVYNNYLTALRADSILADPLSSKPATTLEIMARGMNTLGSNVPPSGPRVNFTPSVSYRFVLNDSIVAAQTLYNKITPGTAKGQVASSVRTTFNTAIGAAITSRDTPTTSDTNIGIAVINLEKAKIIFTNAIIK
ncbi:MAG: hypothetical protein WCK78_01630 [Paludibacter sp.]